MSIINNRKSIRKFKQQEIENEKLIMLAEAGMSAPSSKNKQPWQYVILSEKELLKRFAEFHLNWKILSNADKAIIVCGDLNHDEREIHTVMACAAATENILLKAVELELGAVWLGLYPDEKRVEWTREILSLTEKQIPISLIAIGYSDVDNNKNRVLDEGRIHFNKFSSN